MVGQMLDPVAPKAQGTTCYFQNQFGIQFFTPYNF